MRDGPLRFEIDDDADEPAIVEVTWSGRVVSTKSKDGDGYYNKTVYDPPDVRIVYGGQGVKSGTYRFDVQDAENASSTIKDKEDVEITFKVRTEEKVATEYEPIEPTDGSQNITDLNADTILENLRNNIDTALGASSDKRVVIVGTGIYIEDSQPFSLSTSEQAVADIINSQKLEDDVIPIARVNTTAELPVECFAGFIAQITNSFDGKSDYYLEYESESKIIDNVDLTDTKADGFWKEIAKPYEPFKPSPESMPHMITVVKESDRPEFTFIVSPIEWEPRTAGTAKNNPSFFTDQSPITEVNYYKNRLFMLTRVGTVVTSRAGEIGNIFINTALTPSNIDPIDIVANSNQRVPLHGSEIVNNAMVLFGDTEQYSLSTNDSLLTSETASLTKISNYTFDQKSNPIAIGTNIGFVSSDYTRFYEMTNVYNRGPVDLNERSIQIQTQFGTGRFNMPVASREQSSVVFYKNYSTDDSSNAMYMFRYRQENSQELTQTSWTKWEVDKPIAYASMPQNQMFVVVTDTEQVCTLYYQDSGSTEGLPLSGIQMPPQFTDGWYMKDGKVVDGAPFTTSIKFPTIYPRGKESYDITSNLTIHRVKLSTAAIGTYNLKVERLGYDAYETLIEQTPADDYRSNFPTLMGKRMETVPIYTRNSNLTLSMHTNYNAPMSLFSMTWEGDWNRPYYKSA